MANRIIHFGGCTCSSVPHPHPHPPTSSRANLTRLSFCCKSGSYRSYLVHEDLVVTERIDDIKPLGFYIRRLCDGKETYRMQRRSSLQGVDSRHPRARGRGTSLGAKACVVASERSRGGGIGKVPRHRM